MCGRYVTPDQAAIERVYALRGTASESFLRAGFAQSFNVAPTQDVPTLRVVRDRGGECVLEQMRWGLIPSWAHGEPPGFSTINAKVENLAKAATWRGPWQRGQRCLFPAAGFYEWQVQADGTKRPHYIRPAAAGELFSIAGIYDSSTTADGQRILSCAIITTPANELLAEIHNTKQRMPLIIPRHAVDAWLSGSVAEAAALLVPYPADGMRAHRVSTRVNTPRNNDVTLIARVEAN